MKKVPIEEFIILLKPIKSYLQDYEKSNRAIDILCSSSYATINLSSNLLESYIDLVEKYLECDDWINWFVFDNDFGKRKLTCEHNKKYIIKNEKDLYNFLTIN